MSEELRNKARECWIIANITDNDTVGNVLGIFSTFTDKVQAIELTAEKTKTLLSHIIMVKKEVVLLTDAQKEISQETADATRILNEAKVEIKTLKNELMLLKSWVYCQCKEPLYNKFGMDNCCARCQKAIENHPLTIQLLKDALKIPRSDEQKLKETQIKEADEKCISYGGTGIDE